MSKYPGKSPSPVVQSRVASKKTGIEWPTPEEKLGSGQNPPRHPAMTCSHRRPSVDYVASAPRRALPSGTWTTANRSSMTSSNVKGTWFSRGAICCRRADHRFWLTVMKGDYARHGEAHAHPDDLLWWATGGEFRGESPARIAFLRMILDEDRRDGLTSLEELGFIGSGTA